MSSFEHDIYENNPTGERKAWDSLTRAIAALRQASESIGDGEPLYTEQLRRIVSRLEVFRFDSQPPMLPHHRRGDAYLFVPANAQQEGLLAVESDEYGYEYALQWRVLLPTDNNTTTFWQSALRDSKLDGVVMTFDQATLQNDQITPELVQSYLRHTIEASVDVMSSYAPLRTAYMDEEPGFTLTEYDGDDESDSLGLPIELVDQFFILPE